jgi:carboxypeptidase Q
MGWQQLNTWVRMTAPDTAVLIAQAAPWSPATQGVSGPAIWIEVKEEKDLDKYKGKLAGHIVLYGDMREVKPVEKPLWTRLDDAELKKLAEYPTRPEEQEFDEKQFMKRLELRQKVAQFLAAEHALAVIKPVAMGRTTAAPVAPSLTTTEQPWAGGSTSARMPIRCRLW